MHAFIYIRFSTPKQERGDSERRQLEDCEAFCRRMGWPVVEVIRDLGRSAWTGAHLSAGNLGRFAERVRAGEIPPGSVLVVEKLDRLSRQELRTTHRWMEDLCAQGLSIATADGGKVYNDDNLRNDLPSVFEILIRAKLANDESQQKSERVLARIGANMKLAKTTGRVMTAKGPGWLVMRPDRSGFDVIEDRARLVRHVYEMAAEGKGARWIAKTLNEEGRPAWGKWRKAGSTPTWEIGSIKFMLANPAVEGDYQPGFSNTGPKRTKFTEKIEDYYPRIVPADLVARARGSRKPQDRSPERRSLHRWRRQSFCWRNSLRRMRATDAPENERRKTAKPISPMQHGQPQARLQASYDVSLRAIRARRA